MNIELEFPEDAREARVRSNRNLGDIERWASLAAGAGLAAYGLSRFKSNGWIYAGIGRGRSHRGCAARPGPDSTGRATRARPRRTARQCNAARRG